MAKNECCVSLKNGNLYLGKQAMDILKNKKHLCGDCALPYSMCPKIMSKWQPIEFYGWITEGYQVFISDKVTYHLSPEEQMDLYNTGKYRNNEVPNKEEISVMIPETFVVTKCEKFKSKI